MVFWMNIFFRKTFSWILFLIPLICSSQDSLTKVQKIVINTSHEPSFDTSITNYISLEKIVTGHPITLKKWHYFKTNEIDPTKISTAKLIQLESNFKLDKNGKTPFNGEGWFYTRIYIDSILKAFPLCMRMYQQGASEIYIDDYCIRKVGVIYRDGKLEGKYNSADMPMNFPVSTGSHVLKVRYSNKNFLELFERYGENRPGFTLQLNLETFQFESYFFSNLYFSIFLFGLAIFFFCTGFVHLLLYLFYRKQISNLHYALYAFLLGAVFLLGESQKNATDPEFSLWSGRMIYYLLPISFLMLMWMLLQLFGTKRTKLLRRSAIVVCVILLIRTYNPQLSGFLVFAFIVTSVIVSMTHIIVAIRQKKEGAWIVGTGALLFLLLIGIFLVGNMFGAFFTINLSLNSSAAIFVIILITLAILSIPISMSVYLARGFATTSTRLEAKLIEVENLSQLTIQQEKEKQKILESQKENLEIQVKERTIEILEQKELIEEKNKDITDSINYAKRIQDAILPPLKLIESHFPDSFVYYKPKDIVAGDFYFFEPVNEKIIFAAADCTGHGVPGAIVSVICSNALHRCVKEFNLSHPNQILDKTRELVLETFSKSEKEVKDGMDISLCCLELNQQQQTTNHKLSWSGANNPLWVLKKNASDIIEIKPNKQPIGVSYKPVPFTNNYIDLEKGDIIYLFTDGYEDQFGGHKGKKFKSSEMKNLFLSLRDLKMREQLIKINDALETWRGELEQVDDICVIGIRI